MFDMVVSLPYAVMVYRFVEGALGGLPPCFLRVFVVLCTPAIGAEGPELNPYRLTRYGSRAYVKADIDENPTKLKLL